MNFDQFLSNLPHIIAAELPAESAHLKMVPDQRLEYIKQSNFSSVTPKVAAVLMLLYPKENATHLVLMLRNTYKGVHSDQISFPGGKFETTDHDIEATALRETFEEIGIPAYRVKIVKKFSKVYIPPSNFMVHPFLGICTEEFPFVPDEKEVAAIIELPLTTFLSDDILVLETMTTSYANEIEVPAFKIQEHIVWGATAMILSELKEVLKQSLLFESI